MLTSTPRIRHSGGQNFEPLVSLLSRQIAAMDKLRSAHCRTSLSGPSRLTFRGSYRVAPSIGIGKPGGGGVSTASTVDPISRSRELPTKRLLMQADHVRSQSDRVRVPCSCLDWQLSGVERECCHELRCFFVTQNRHQRTVSNQADAYPTRTLSKLWSSKLWSQARECCHVTYSIESS
jgi:hypothetical protein